MKKIFLVLIVPLISLVALVSLVPLFPPVPPVHAAPANQVEVIMFTQTGCQHCANLKAALANLKTTVYPEINFIEYELHEGQNALIFNQYARAYDFSTVATPVTVIGDKFFEGDNVAELARLLSGCREKACLSPASVVADYEKINGALNQSVAPVNQTATVVGYVVLGVIGVIVVGGMYWSLRSKKSQ
jgi:glutaredoxin